MKISIVTINYNGNVFLRKSLESVLCQDDVDLEVVVVDGGSTDGSVETLKEISGNDPRLNWRSEPDEGISDAMNKGLARVSGEIVAFLHSDDTYPKKDVLGTVQATFEAESDVLWVTGGIEIIDENGQGRNSLPPRRYSRRRLERCNILFHPATFIRTDILRKVGGFNTSFKLAMDYDLWLRMAALAPPRVLSRPLACFRVHQGSRSMQAAGDAIDEEFDIRLRYLERQNRPIVFYRLHHGLRRILTPWMVRKMQPGKGGRGACQR